MKNFEILPLEYGKSVLPESMIFENGANDKTRPIVFMVYLIKSADKNILVDAGCVTMPGFVMEDFIGPIRALEKIDMTADDITDVIVTHSHHDHIECVGCFENADIYIQRDEYESGKNYFKDGMKIMAFDNEAEICKNVKVLKIGGHSKGSSIVEINDNGCTYVIVGDECYLRECLEKGIPTGTSCCPQKSKEFIKKYSDPKYNILLCHDK